PSDFHHYDVFGLPKTTAQIKNGARIESPIDTTSLAISLISDPAKTGSDHQNPGSTAPRCVDDIWDRRTLGE
ncbi:MAG: hypothetical protein PVI97_09750, partial [Candidatus Thiodiazotropha sp.]